MNVHVWGTEGKEGRGTLGSPSLATKTSEELPPHAKPQREPILEYLQGARVTSPGNQKWRVPMRGYIWVQICACGGPRQHQMSSSKFSTAHSCTSLLATLLW